MKRFSFPFRILDFPLLALIILTAVFSMKKSVKSNGNNVVVNANGTMFEYSLTQEGTYTVEGLIGYTTFEIKNGGVRIIDSPCPNKTCIEQGWGNPLICLPNKVIINVEGYGEFDAISE